MLKKEFNRIKSELRNYYSKADLYVPTGSNWRFWKVILHDKRCIFIKDRIYTPEQLRKVLLKLISEDKLPFHIYFSASTFLNPTTAERNNYKYADRCFLDNLLVFDIDEENLKKAKEEAQKIESYMDFLENEYLLMYRLLTSQKGIHLVYLDKKPSYNPDPRIREKETKEKRVRLVEQMKKENLKADWDITVDMNRIIRCGHTINMKDGTKTKFFNHYDFIPESPFISPPKASEEKSNDGNLSSQPVGERERPRLISSHKFFISNAIDGVTDKFVLFLKYPKDRIFMDDLNRLIKLYNLSNVHLVEAPHYVVAISLQALSHKRICKILKASNSLEKNQQEKIHRTFAELPFSRLLASLEDNAVPNCELSMPHALYLNQLFNIKKHNCRYVGSNTKVRECVVNEQRKI